MDGIHAFLFGDGDDAFDVEIGTERAFVLVQLVGFICLEAMRAKAVLRRIDTYRFQPEFRSRPHDADGNFRTVCDHQFLDGSDGCG